MGINFSLHHNLLLSPPFILLCFVHPSALHLNLWLLFQPHVCKEKAESEGMRHRGDAEREEKRGVKEAAGRSNRPDATLTSTGAGNPTCTRLRGFCKEATRVESGKTFSHVNERETRESGRGDMQDGKSKGIKNASKAF